MERRLAAILAADMVGYSRLMGKDEAGTLARLTQLRKEQIEPLIAEHRGRVFKLTGDGILVEFASVVDAVSCAVAWQTGLSGAELRFRIGVNLGEVIAEDDDIYGNGVNIAARLETVADPGGVCLSGNVHDEIRGKLDLTFQDMGAQSLKNIAEPVRAYRIILGNAEPSIEQSKAEPAQPQPPPTNRSGKPALAVLPLSNMSGDTGQDGFADGLTEDLITALSSSHAFDVTARNSTFAYKGKSPDIREVAQALSVNYVLEGSIRRGGSRARITVQLIDAATGNHVWAERFDRSLDDEFAVQDEITQRVSSILIERVWQDVARNIKIRELQNYTPYDYAFRSMELLHRFDPHSLQQAIEFLEAGLALDPDHRYCHGILGYCFNISTMFWDNQNGALASKAHHHAMRMNEIEADANSYRLLSRTHSVHHRWDEAWDCVQRSQRLNSNDGDIIGNRGLYHLFHGEYDQAVEWIDKVLEMHTDTPHTVDIMRYWKALAHFVSTDYLAASSLLRSISGLDFLRSQLLAACHVRLSEVEKANTQAAEVLRIYPAFGLQNINLWRSFRNQSDGQNLLDALRKAGLPD